MGMHPIPRHRLVIASHRSRTSRTVTDDRSLLKRNLEMLQELGAVDHSNNYKRDFEGLFLGTTQEFYRNESLTFLSQNTVEGRRRRQRQQYPIRNSSSTLWTSWSRIRRSTTTTRRTTRTTATNNNNNNNNGAFFIIPNYLKLTFCWKNEIASNCF